MVLQSLRVMPPLGSFKDRYLRMVLTHERRIEFQKTLMEFVAFRHKVSPEGIVADNKTGYDIFKKLIKLYYPEADVEQQDQDNMMKKALERFIEKTKNLSLMADEPEDAPEHQPMDVTPVERKSIWGQMQEGLQDDSP